MIHVRNVGGAVLGWVVMAGMIFLLFSGAMDDPWGGGSIPAGELGSDGNVVAPDRSSSACSRRSSGVWCAPGWPRMTADS